MRIHYNDPSRHEALHELVVKLHENDVFEPCHTHTSFYLFVVLARNTEQYVASITYTSKLNEFLLVKSLKMDTSNVIRQALTDKLWTVGVDFSNAYYHIPLHAKHLKYLAFQVGDTRYFVSKQLRLVSACCHRCRADNGSGC